MSRCVKKCRPYPTSKITSSPVPKAVYPYTIAALLASIKKLGLFRFSRSVSFDWVFRRRSFMSVVKEYVHKKRRKSNSQCILFLFMWFQANKAKAHLLFSNSTLCVPFFGFFSQRSKHLCNFLYFMFFHCNLFWRRSIWRSFRIYSFHRLRGQHLFNFLFGGKTAIILCVFIL